MKILKKTILYIVIICFCIRCLCPSYVFAQDGNESNTCSACKSTPSAMQLYINFEVEILEALQETSETKESLGENKNLGLFAGGGLAVAKAFYKSTKQRLKRQFDSEIRAVRALNIATVLLGEMTLENIDSASASISILFKDSAFVRDYKILQELEMSANDVIWDMGMLGIWDDKASSQVQAKIQGLQSKYSLVYNGDTPIFTRLSISGSVKNRHLLSFVLRVNGLMKNMLASVHNSDAIDKALDTFESWYSNGSIIAEINRDYIESIQSDYSCATMTTCNKTVKEAVKGLVNVSKLKASFGRSRDTIKDAWHNLTELKNPFKTYAKSVRGADNSGGLTQRQIELLRTTYGIDSKDLTDSQIATWKRNRANIKKQLNPFSDAVKSRNKKSVFDGTKDTEAKSQDMGNEQQKVRKEKLTDEERAKLENEIYRQSILPNSTNDTLLLEELQNVTAGMLSEKANDKGILLVGLNLSTHYFVEIGSYIHYIVDGVIPDTLNNLGDACTYQCGNLGTANCYPGD